MNVIIEIEDKNIPVKSPCPKNLIISINDINTKQKHIINIANNFIILFFY